MLWTLFVVLLVLWLIGVVSSYTIGGFIHILLVIAIAVYITKRRPIAISETEPAEAPAAS